MAQFAVVKASDLARHGRMDAEFHMAANRTASAVKALESRYTKKQAADMLGKLDMTVLAAVKPLLRGGSRPRSPGREDYLRAVDEYPHMALALVREAGQASMDRIRSEIARHEQALEDLREVMGEAN